MLKTSTDNVPGKQITEVLGVVFGNVLYSVSQSQDSATHEQLHKNAVTDSMDRLDKEAAALGADAIVGVSVSFSALGTIDQVAVTATGTAVRFPHSGEDQEKVAQQKAEQAQLDLEAANRRREEEQANSRRAMEEAQNMATQAAAAAAAPAAASDANVSALETSLINLLLKHPDGMDGVSISKKIPRIYYSPAEVSSALKHLVELNLLYKDEFGVFKVN